MVFNTVQDIRTNANHLMHVEEYILQQCIDDAYVIYIKPYVRRIADDILKILERLLAQHMATINVRRADKETVGELSKSISVVRSENLGQTEYGQAAKGIAGELGMHWALDGKKADIRIF